MDNSPYLLCKQLEEQLKRLLVDQDISHLPTDVRQAVSSLRRVMADARLDTRDYEYAESHAEQTKHAEAAVKHLEHARQTVLLASEYNVFSAIDVAHTTAIIEQITKQL